MEEEIKHILNVYTYSLFKGKTPDEIRKIVKPYLDETVERLLKLLEKELSS